MKADGQEFANILRSLEQIIQTDEGQNIFEWSMKEIFGTSSINQVLSKFEIW